MRFYAYLQCLRAGWKPWENICVKAGDCVSLPLRALADSRAGVSPRHGADMESDKRKQRACYHLHARVLLAVSVGSKYPQTDFCVSTW